MRLVFTPHGWEDYTVWVETDPAMLKRVNRLIDAALRDRRPVSVQARYHH